MEFTSDVNTLDSIMMRLATLEPGKIQETVQRLLPRILPMLCQVFKISFKNVAHLSWFLLPACFYFSEFLFFHFSFKIFNEFHRISGISSNSINLHLIKLFKLY